MSITDLFDLSGKTAFVTGASRGLGAAAADVLAEAGANVVLVGRHRETLEEVDAALRPHGVDTLRIECDVADRDRTVEAVARATGHFGAIDILVNNAGIIRRGPAERYTLEDWDAVMEVNLTAAFHLCREIGRGMLSRGGGRIINIASLLSYSGGLNVVAYTASKSGLAGVTRALANEWASRGVNVNAIAPGYFHTAATDALQQDRERYEALRHRIPARRWGEPKDLRGAVLFLASPASDYVNGHVLAVDGGWMAA